MSNPAHRPLHGITLKLVSVGLFIVMQALIKYASDQVPPGEAAFFRSLCALPVVLAWLYVTGQWQAGLRPNKPLSLFWRGLMGTVSMGLGFAGLAYLPLPEVTALSYATPLLVVIFAAMYFDEKVGPVKSFALLTGLVGVSVILAPRLTVFQGAGPNYANAFGASLVLGSALFAALAQIVLRKALVTDRTPIIVFWYSLTATGITLCSAVFGWVMPGPQQAVALILSGLVGGVAQILMTESNRHAKASTIAPLDYTALLFAVIVGYFAFDEVPGTSLIFGAPFIILAGLLVTLKHGKQG